MTDTNVVTLSEVSAKPVESVIELLEKILADAKAGKITAVALATTTPAGGTGTAWTGDAWVSHLLGSVAMLQHRLTQRIDTYD